MSGETKAELVFIPSPGRGHLIAAMEMAKLLLDRGRDRCLSITMLLIKPFFNPKSSADQFSSFSRQLISGIRFIDIPQVESRATGSDPFSFQSQFVESHKDPVRNVIAKIMHECGENGNRLAGFVVDMYCTSMMDVAQEFSIPAYVFFTSGAAVLGLMFHFQGLRDYQNQDLVQSLDSGDEILIPTYKNPVPVGVLPGVMFEKDGGSAVFFDHVRRFREAKGIMVNTFLEFESHAMKSLCEDQKIPPVFPVGPILHLHNGDDLGGNPEYYEIMKWLDDQPDSSVVFLCFGSKGCFDEYQVKHIAMALERCGHRFLWSLMKPSPKHKFDTPDEYENPREVLPPGFQERTVGFGKVIGWAPQTAVLSHRAVAGFVSHCGWNSVLESVWFGMPMAAWPLSAEQQANAFELVMELGVAVEIKMDYKKGSGVIVTADEIESGIRTLMKNDGDVKANIQKMKMKSRAAIRDKGSSFGFVGDFIDQVINNIS